jgi:sorbitol/mannitol transport system substrate-binding protein
MFSLSEITRSELSFTVLRNGEHITLQTPEGFLDKLARNPDFLDLSNVLPSQVGQVVGGSPAEEAGLQDDDRIVAIDGEPVGYWLQMVEKIRSAVGDRMEIAAELHDPGRAFAGICLRGLAGWGEVMAPMSTAINTFGGQWFDEDWNARLDSPQVRDAVETYVDTVRRYGQPGAATSGFGDCLTRFAQGNAAMWYDATSMVSSVEDPASSTVAGDVGYAPAPVSETDAAGWLYSWSLAVPSTSEHKDAAWDFISWMTDKDYIRLVGEELSWERVPPGSRLSTYEIPQYAEVSAAYADATLASMNAATQDNTMATPVPYPGIQFVGIPEFQDLGTRVGQQMSAAIAGQKSVAEALEQSQRYAQTVADTYQSTEDAAAQDTQAGGTP